jgi:hypothetical protein
MKIILIAMHVAAAVALQVLKGKITLVIVLKCSQYMIKNKSINLISAF